MDESRGIYIEGENRVFAAEWDDYPVDVDRFWPLERSARQEEAENGVEKFFQRLLTVCLRKKRFLKKKKLL